MDVMSELADFLGDHAVETLYKFRDIPARPVRGWKERNLVAPVTGNSLPEVHELVADTGRIAMGRSPDRIWLIAGRTRGRGCATRKRSSSPSSGNGRPTTR
jgi:hypothetical protein